MASNRATFAERVYAYVATIPRGETRSYGEVANAIGHPRAARAVGTVLAKNYDPSIPCHRVICADGRLGNYNRGEASKRRKLIEEGAL